MLLWVVTASGTLSGTSDPVEGWDPDKEPRIWLYIIRITIMAIMRIYFNSPLRCARESGIKKYKNTARQNTVSALVNVFRLAIDDII